MKYEVRPKIGSFGQLNGQARVGFLYGSLLTNCETVMTNVRRICDDNINMWEMNASFRP